MFGDFHSKTWACATFSFSLEGAKCRRVFPELKLVDRNYEQKKVALWTAKKGGGGQMINQERFKGSDILYPAIIYFYMDMCLTGRDRRGGFDDKRRIFFIIFPFVNFTLSF